MTNWESIACSQKQRDPQTISEQQPLWSQPPPPLSALTTAVFIADHCSVVWSPPLASSGHLSCLCPLPVCCPHQACLLVGEAGVMETEWDGGNALALCKHCSAAGKAWVLYQHCFSHKSKTECQVGCYEQCSLQPDHIHVLTTDYDQES